MQLLAAGDHPRLRPSSSVPAPRSILTPARRHPLRAELAAELKTKKVGALKGLLGGLSENLASLNHDRYQAFAAAPGTAPVDGKLRPSAFAYDGPAFKGLGIDGLDKTAQG